MQTFPSLSSYPGFVEQREEKKTENETNEQMKKTPGKTFLTQSS